MSEECLFFFFLFFDVGNNIRAILDEYYVLGPKQCAYVDEYVHYVVNEHKLNLELPDWYRILASPPPLHAHLERYNAYL